MREKERERQRERERERERENTENIDYSQPPFFSLRSKHVYTLQACTIKAPEMKSLAQSVLEQHGTQAIHACVYYIRISILFSYMYRCC